MKKKLRRKENYCMYLYLLCLYFRKNETFVVISIPSQ